MASELDRADKVHPSAELLLDHQKRTLAARSNDLKELTTPEIIQKYPWLNMPKLVCNYSVSYVKNFKFSKTATVS